MAHLHDLPNEILSDIIESVHPDGLENFLSLSDHLKLLGKDRLEEHRALQLTYAKYDCTNDTHAHTYLLHDIMENPRVAAYVKELRIDGWSSEFEPDNLRPRHDELLITTFKEAASESGIQFTVDKWHNSIDKGDEDPIIALLLLRLSNLETLIIESFGQSKHFVQAILEDCAARSEMTGSQPFLSRLHNVELHSKEYTNVYNFDNVVGFARIPSVQCMTVWKIQTVGKDLTNDLRLEPRMSHVSALHGKFSNMDPEHFYQLLGAFDKLKILSMYGVRFYDDRLDDVIDLKRVRAALSIHAEKGLECIKVIYLGSKHHYLGGFGSFTTLKSLDVEIDSLFRSVDRTEDDSTNVQGLPLSLEKLCLRLSKPFPRHSGLPELIETLLVVKDQHTPNLQEVRVITDKGWEDLELDGETNSPYIKLRERYADAGVRLMVEPLDGFSNSPYDLKFITQ